MPKKIKNSNGLENHWIELDDFRNNGKKKNLRGNFWGLWGELPNRIRSLNIYCINRVYIAWKDSFKDLCEKIVKSGGVEKTNKKIIIIIDLRVMLIKEYLLLLRVPELKPHHKKQLMLYLKNILGWVCRGC